MAKRGIRKHLKRLRAPKHWMLGKLGGIFATKPNQGPHKLRQCVPLSVIIRNKLKLALNGREVKHIVNSKDGNIAIDGKIRKDVKYPVGLMDVLTLLKTKANYRVLYDSKGRFGLHKISANEAEYKLCQVKTRAMGAKGVPYIVTHDARTIRFPAPEIKAGDTVKINLRNGEVSGHYKFAEGSNVIISRGNNVGRTGSIVKIEKHDGAYDIIYIKDNLGKEFSTRVTNVFIIGGNKNEISLMKSHNRLSIIQERDLKTSRTGAVEVDEEEEAEN